MRAYLPRSLRRLGNIAEVDLGIAPPVMKSFKEFLLSLDDSIDETEAVKRYNDYKLEFRRQQMQDFFLAHKDEEWYVSRGLGLPPLWRGAWNKVGEGRFAQPMPLAPSGWQSNEAL